MADRESDLRIVLAQRQRIAETKFRNIPEAATGFIMTPVTRCIQKPNCSYSRIWDALCGWVNSPVKSKPRRSRCSVIESIN